MEETLNKILLKIISMEEKMENFVTKDELKEAKNEIIGDIDNFVKLHTTVDQ